MMLEYQQKKQLMVATLCDVTRCTLYLVLMFRRNVLLSFPGKVQVCP